MRQTLLSIGIVSTMCSIVGLLAWAHVTGFDGYSYTYCDTFSLVTKVEAHGIEDLSPDQKRINDLHTLVHQLKVYKNINGTYPVYTEAVPVSAVTELSVVVSDPCVEKNDAYNYYYISDVVGSEYVLKALLSDSGYRYVHMQHSDGVEGEQLGFWCGEGVHKRSFCLRSHNDTHHAHMKMIETELPISVSLGTTSVPGQIHITTNSFLFSEDLVGAKHIDGYGHAHLYIDGVKTRRVFSETFMLPELSAGSYEVKIILNTNDHAVYVRDGEEMAESLIITI